MFRSEDALLRCILQSLACGKKKVLKKRPPGKDVNDEDVFVFNDAFEDPRAKVHINSIQVKETVRAALPPCTLLLLTSHRRLRPFAARGIATHAECGRGRPEALPRRGDSACHESA